MIQYSDSSGDEEGPGAVTSPAAGVRGGRGSGRAPPQSDDSKAKVRFRYSKGMQGCRTA